MRNLICVLIAILIILFSIFTYSYIYSNKQHALSQSVFFGISLFLLLFFTGFIIYFISWYKLSAPWPDIPRTYEAIVADNIKIGEKVVSFEAYVYPEDNRTDIDDREYRKIRVVIKKDSASQKLDAGDRLMFNSRISKIRNSGNPREFDSESYWLNKGVSGEVFIWNQFWKKTGVYENTCMFNTMSFKIYFIRLRNKIINLYRKTGLDGDSFYFFTALTLGERKGMPSYINELYTKAGVSHILALSGMHLGFFVAILNFLFVSRVHKKFLYVSSVLFSILVIWIYTFLSGMPASLVRATCMYSIMFMVRLLKRDGFSVNALFVTAFLMLSVNPLWLFDIGFQLSFLAMFGILFLYPRLKDLIVIKRNIVTDYIINSISISFCAQVFTVPLVLYYWGTFAFYSLLATLILSPIIALLMCCMPLLCISAFVFRDLSLYIVEVITFLYTIQDSILKIIVEWPLSVLRYNLNVFSLLLLYAFIIFCLNNTLFTTRFKFRFTVIWGLLFFISLVYPSINDKYPQMIIYNNKRNTAVHILYSKDESYLKLGGRYLRAANNKISDDIIDNSGMGYIKTSYWDRENIDMPVLIGGKYKNERIVSYNGFVNVNGYISILVPSSLRDTTLYGNNLIKNTDYFIIDKNYDGSLAGLYRLNKSGVMVLDATLSSLQRRKYMAECEKLNIKVYDVEKQGALKVILK